MSNSNLAIKADKVSLKYWNKGTFLKKKSSSNVLIDVSIDVPIGSRLAILGKNGAGKSSLLRVLAGLISPNRGTVTSFENSSHYLTLGVGFDGNLSGYHNVILSGMYHGCSGRYIRELAPRIAEYSELGSYIDKPVRTYSTGMRSRLGFSIALHLNADILLLDEVLSVGDEDFRQKAEASIVEKIFNQKTFIFVSHSLHQVARLCDRAILLEHGRVVTSGPINEVLDEYKGTLQQIAS